MFNGTEKDSLGYVDFLGKYNQNNSFNLSKYRNDFGRD